MRNRLCSALAACAMLLVSSTAWAAGPPATLSLGSRGADVAILQRLLTHGGEPVAITALVGPTTEGLIKRFQAKNGLPANGVVDQPTWRALQPTMRLGHGSEAVKALQVALNEKHGFQLAQDGLFGMRTDAAVRQFQAHMGLVADGVVGPMTWAALVGHYAPLGSAGPGWYRYETINRDGAWGTAHTVATVEAVARQWHQAGHAVRLGIGDISLPHGGPIPGHRSHQRGVDVDIRVVRNDGREAPVKYWDSAYSRSRTQELVNRLLATGEVDVIFFNDPHVEGVRPWPNHDHHMHVRFKR